ncbi:MAG: thioredoxin domain-containing protein [Myxococcota bacterium]|nr:thioredoxin domain-containing protein [Myxococcota bacterium]
MGCSKDAVDYWKGADSNSPSNSDATTGQCSIDTENPGCLDTDPLPSDTQSGNGTTESQTGPKDTSTVLDRYPDFCGNSDFLPYAMSDAQPFDRTSAPYRGTPAMAEIIVDVYAYFYCPHCRDAADAFAQMYEDPRYASRTALYFGHYAFSDDIDASPWNPHRAAHAAHLQGKFWPMHDLIFASAGQLDYPGLTTMAQSLDLDMSQYAADYASAQTESYLMADRDEVRAAGAEGTPAAFVNGLLVQPWTIVRDVVDCLLGF